VKGPLRFNTFVYTVCVNIAIMAIPVFPEVVRDFAPLQVGNKWTYQSKTDYSGFVGTRISTITIQVNAVTQSGADSLFILNTVEQGFDSVTSTTISNSFSDTVKKGADSIVFLHKPLRISPIWNSYAINKDSLSKIEVLENSLFSYKIQTSSELGAFTITEQFTYVQNIGLYAYRRLSTSIAQIMPSTESITLLNFNGQQYTSCLTGPHINKSIVTHIRCAVPCLQIIKGRSVQSSVSIAINGRKCMSSRISPLRQIAIRKTHN
jgi:hypothetical protein